MQAVDEFRSITGKGVTGLVGGHRVGLGNESLLKELGVEADASHIDHANKLRSAGETVVFVTVDGAVRGLIGVSDPIKDSSRDAIQGLRQRSSS